MKVCFFIPSLGDGGAQRQCIALLNALQEQTDIELHLLLLGPGEHEDELDVHNLHVHRTAVGNFADPRALLFVLRSLKRVRPDVLISWLHPADIWSFAATRVIRRLPWILTERGSVYPDTLAFNFRKQIGRLSATAIIANSEAGQKMWLGLRPKAKVQMIPNMVIEKKDNRPDDTEDLTPAEFLFVGRLEPEKNLLGAVTAFAAFADNHPCVRFSVVGKGSQEADLIQVATDCGVGDRVDLLGFRKDVASLMSRARVFLSLSLYEGMPNVVMEAVRAGLPAVVSDIAEHRALLGDDYPYYVRLDDDTERTASVIARAWQEGRANIAQNYAHAREVLTASAPERVASAYARAFAEVIDQRKVPRVVRSHQIQRYLP